MPYFLIGKEELKTRPDAVEKLKKILAERCGEKRLNKGLWNLIKKSIEQGSSSFLLSVNSKGEPKGFIQFRLPKNKKASVVTMLTYVSPKFRGKGEATRLTYRLIAIAKRAGYKGIYRPSLNEPMVRLSKKMRANPRKIIGKEGKAKISRETGRPLKAEDISVFSVYEGPLYRFGSAKIKFKPLTDKMQSKTKQQARRIRKRI